MSIFTCVLLSQTFVWEPGFILKSCSVLQDLLFELLHKILGQKWVFHVMKDWPLKAVKFSTPMWVTKKNFFSSLIKNTYPIGPKKNPNPAQQVDLTKKVKFWSDLMPSSWIKAQGMYCISCLSPASACSVAVHTEAWLQDGNVITWEKIGSLQTGVTTNTHCLRLFGMSWEEIWLNSLSFERQCNYKYIIFKHMSMSVIWVIWVM